MENKYPVRHAQVAARVIDGEAVVVLADSGEIKILNSVGTRIWELIDGKHSTAQITRMVTEEFDVSPEQADRDTTEFLQELVSVGAVVLRDAPETAGS